MHQRTLVPLFLAFFLSTGAPALGGGSAAETGAQECPGDGFDCNGNGIEDSVDIAEGTSGDRDMNGVPDECERAAQRPLVSSGPLTLARSVRAVGVNRTPHPTTRRTALRAGSLFLRDPRSREAQLE